MTDLLTHYFLSSALVWMGLGRKRVLFTSSWKNKMLFSIVGLSAVVMDLDVLFLTPMKHRLLTHTVMLPLMFLLLGLTIRLFMPKRETAMTCCLAMSVLMGLHLILDMDSPPPMGLFYPLLDRCYLAQLIIDWNRNYASLNLTIKEFSIQEWSGQTGGSFGLNMGTMFLSLIIFMLTIGKDFAKSKIYKDEGVLGRTEKNCQYPEKRSIFDERV